jgi:predicted NUDIX family phosphoesterase
LHEELEIPGPYRQRAVALINDDSNEVGRVHLGVVHLVEVDSMDIRPREEAIRDLTFLTAAELQEQRNRLESWSQIVADALPQLLVS